MPEFSSGHRYPDGFTNPGLRPLPAHDLGEGMQRFQAMMVEDDEALQVLGLNEARFKKLNGKLAIAPLRTNYGTPEWGDALMLAMAANPHICNLAEEAGLKFVNCEPHDQ